MGGLVIKKAYILGRQLPEYESLAHRIRALFFLATPHKGAGIAQLLSRVLTLAPGSRPFVNDLFPQSETLQSINEEFPRYSRDLQLFSFYETQPMYYGIGKGLIVEKHCAVMNYPNEQRTYLDANHRDVARFSAPSEPSYVLVRNALAMTIENQRSLLDSSMQVAKHDVMAALSSFLTVSSAPEDDLIAYDFQKLRGTCEWFLQRDTFQQWRDAVSPKVLWLRGRPGAGKSVLASHVVNHLRTLNLDCSYFFFAEGDEGKATVNALLRSMAWQMAVLHPTICSEVSNLANNWRDTPIDKADHIPVWRRIFSAGILKVGLKKPQYWVIDALDECRSGPDLIHFIKKAQEVWPLHVFITSRDGMKTCTISNPAMEVVPETIRDENKADIAAFLSANIQSLPGATMEAQKSIADRILHKSCGCFLWVNLVLRELRQVHTSAEINQVLDSNPSDMSALYSRILHDMSGAKFGKDLVKALLTWTTCALRPLTTEEIHYAIEKDINDSIDDIGKSIDSYCSDLIYIDKARKVQFIHLTAKEFLMRNDLESEYRIDRESSHKRLALVCLRVFLDDQGSLRRPSKARRLGSDVAANIRSPLYEYASTYLFEHLLQVRFSDSEVFIELAKFLGSREVLNWIEGLSRRSDLRRLYEAGKTCTRMATGRTQHFSSTLIQKQITLVQQWGVDLSRLVNKFGKQLGQFPSSIHHLIPPFCPTESALRRQFANNYRGLYIQGCVPAGWDDCLLTLSYPRFNKPINIASSENYTALTLLKG